MGITLRATTDCEEEEEGAICTTDQRPLSAAVSVTVPGPANSQATGSPTISGTAQVGETLTANPGDISDGDGLTGATFGYQWLSDGAGIAGATQSTYTLEEADEGRAIRVRVSFTDDAGHGETLTSTATGNVAPRPNRPASGMVQAQGIWAGEITVGNDPSGSGAMGYSTFSTGMGSITDPIFTIEEIGA